MDSESLTIAIEKLESMEEHHPSMVMYSEAKMLYKLVPILRRAMEEELETMNNCYILELAKVISEETKEKK